MNIDRLRSIIKYSEKNRAEIESWVQTFYSYAGVSNDDALINVMQIVKAVLLRKGYIALELPLNDEGIGALCYKGDALGYIIMNSSIAKVNMNFAICHELYHVLCQQDGFHSKVEFTDSYYDDNNKEMAANLFAGMLLMPKNSFRVMYNKFVNDSKGDEFETIIRLMSYYQVPYMAALVRCLELQLMENVSDIEAIISASAEEIRREFFSLWLDDSILDSTKKDDYRKIKEAVKKIGSEYIADEYLHKNKLDRVLKNMDILYSEIKGE